VTDNAARWKTNYSIVVCTLAYGLFNSLVLGRNESSVTWEAIGLCFVLAGVSSVRYCFQSSKKFRGARLAGRDIPVLRRPVLTVMGAAAAAIFVTLANVVPFSGLEAAVVDERFRRLSTGNLNDARLRKAMEMAEVSRKLNIRAHPSVVSKFTRRAIEASTSKPELRALAWQTAQACLGYRSFLNPPSPAKPAPTDSSMSELGWIVSISKGRHAADNLMASFGPFPFTVVSVKIAAWSDTPYGMAVYEPIGTGRNKGINSGPAFIVLQGKGGDLALDGLSAKHVEFDNLQIVYRGGRVVLQDVRFVNCNFRIEMRPSGVTFANELLAPGRVNFVSPLS